MSRILLRKYCMSGIVEFLDMLNVMFRVPAESSREKREGGVVCAPS